MLKRVVLLIIGVSMIMVVFSAIPVKADSTSLENKENFSITTSTYDQSLLVGSVTGYTLTAGDVLFVSWKGNSSPFLSAPRVYLLTDYQFHGWDYFRKCSFMDPASRGWILRNSSWEMTLNYSITSSDTYYVIIDNPNWIPDILPQSIDIISYEAVQNYPNSYYLSVRTDPAGIVSIPGENWYLRGYDKILTAPFAVTVNSSFQYRFQYWDVDGVSYEIDVNTITVEMNSNHTAIAHYVPRRLLEHDGGFNVRFSTRDPHWSTPHTLNGSINGYSLTSGQVLFVSWSIVVQPLESTPYIYLLDSYQVQGWYWSDFLHEGVASHGYLKLVESWQGTIDYQIAYLDTYYVIISNRNPYMGIVGKTPIDITSYDAYLALPASYYLSVKTDPEGITSIPGEGWYSEGSNPVLSAPAIVSVSSNTQYRFEYWDVDGVSYGIGVNPITVSMNENHSATAHYVLQCKVTFNQTGLDSSAITTVVSINGVPKMYSDLPYVFWIDSGRVIMFSYNETVSSSTSGKSFALRNVTGPTSPIMVTSPLTVTGNYMTQYYLTVVSPYDSPTPTSGWFDAGTLITASVTSPWPGPTGVQYSCTGWTGTGSVPASGSAASVDFTINEPSSITWTWKTQYYLTVSSDHGTTGGEGWYDAGDTAYATVTPLTVPGPTGVRHFFTHWSEDASGNTSPSNPITMDSPKIAAANWKTRYKLIVKTNPAGLSPGPTPPTDWYDKSTDVILTAQTVSGYTFNHWDVDGASNGTGVNPITVHMDNPHTATAHYQTVAPPPPPPAVGGEMILIKVDKPPLTLTHVYTWIGLASAIISTTAVSVIYVKHRKKQKT